MARTYGNCRGSKKKTKAIVCIGLLLICLCGFVGVVAAGDDYPDPLSVDPIVCENCIPVLPVGTPMENHIVSSNR